MSLHRRSRWEHEYAQAKVKMAPLVQGGVKLENRSGRDRYGRILAYARPRSVRNGQPPARQHDRRVGPHAFASGSVRGARLSGYAA